MAQPEQLFLKFRSRKYRKHKNNPTSFRPGQVPWNKGRKGPIPWNKGLTKASDPRVARYARTLSIVNAGKRFQLDYSDPEYRKMLRMRMLGDKNPSKRKGVRDKIRTTLMNTYKHHPEILVNRKLSGINQFSGSYSTIEKPIVMELRNRNILFIHNYRIGKYFADFFIMDNVVVECDGEYWHRDAEKERRRDAYLMDRGFYVFHLWGQRILQDPVECIDMVTSVMKALGWAA